MSTKYKQPRKFNIVSISLGIVLVAGLYGGWMYGPSYYRAKKVDGVLDDVRRDAGRFIVGTGDPREGAILETLRREVVKAGVDESTLRIYFADEGKSLNVEFTEIVEHPVGDPIVWKFHRKEKIVPVGR